MFTINLTHDYARRSAKDLKKYLENLNVKIRLTEAQEAIARSLRHKDWTRLVANIKKNEQQTALTLNESTISINTNTSAYVVNTTLRVKDEKGVGNANVSDIYFALKSFLEDHPFKYNRMYLPEDHSDHLTDVGIYQAADGKSNSKWIQLIFGQSRNVVYVKPKELDIFIPKNSKEYAYLRLEIDKYSVPQSIIPGSPFGWFVDERGCLPMSNDNYIGSLPTVEETGVPNEAHLLVKKYHTGTFLLEMFEPYPIANSTFENTLDDDKVHNGAMTNSEYRSHIWCNTSQYGPIIPKALINPSNNLKPIKGAKK